MATMRTPLARVRGLGSAKEGVGHWKLQRITAIANLVCVIWFVIVAVSMSGAGYGQWHALFGSPFHATMMILLVVTSFWHSQLGLQVVIEDYIHEPFTKISLLLANIILHAAFGLACIVAVLMIAVT